MRNIADFRALTTGTPMIVASTVMKVLSKG